MALLRADRATAPVGPVQGWLQRSHRLFVVLALLVGTTASAVLAGQWDASARRTTQEHTEREMQAATARLREGLDSYTRALTAEQAFYAASADQVSQARFSAFVTAMSLPRDYPGLQGLSFVQAVPAAGLAAFVAANRADGRPGFGVQPAGNRDVYWVIRYSEPRLPADRALFREMLYSFEKLTRRGLEQLDAESAAGRLGQVAELTHSLTGAAANLGVTTLAGLLAQLEDGARLDPPVLPPDLLPRARAEFEAVGVALQAIVADLGEARSSSA